MFSVRLVAALAVVLVGLGTGVALAGASEDVAAAHAAVRRGDDAAAIQLFTRALADPSLRGAQRGAVYMNRADVFERQKRYAAVISDMRQAVALRPHDWVAYYGLGLGYHLSGDPTRAIAEYSRGLAVASDPALLNGRGRAYRDTGDDRRARADFERAIALAPNYAFAYRNLGMLEYDQLNYDAAFADFDRWVELDSKNYDSYQWRGATAFERNQPAAALADIDRAIALNPEALNAYRWRGLINFLSHDFTASAADFDAADRLKPTVYNAVWAYLARLRAGTAGEAALRTAAARFDADAWPGPLVGLVLGERTYRDVRERAQAGVPATAAAANRCEAAFYAAELALSRNDRETARPLLDEALATCPVHYVEHDGALHELRWLGASPSPSPSP